MAYSPYYSPYQNQMFNPYQVPQYSGQINQQNQPMQHPIQQPAQQQQIQNGGLVSVHNETEARNYPIAIGTSITFKDENAPYVYTKTMGFSQLESPKFDKYRLVKEEASEQPQAGQNEPKEAHACSCNLEKVEAKIAALESEIEGIKKKMVAKPGTKKKEAEEDES